MSTLSCQGWDTTTTEYVHGEDDLTPKVSLRCVGDVTAKPPHAGDGLIKMSAIDRKHTADGMGDTGCCGLVVVDRPAPDLTF